MSAKIGSVIIAVATLLLASAILVGIYDESNEINHFWSIAGLTISSAFFIGLALLIFKVLLIGAMWISLVLLGLFILLAIYSKKTDKDGNPYTNPDNFWWYIIAALIMLIVFIGLVIFQGFVIFG